MIILAIDTSSIACSVAVLISQTGQPDVLHTHHQIAPMQQTALLLPSIESLLKKASLTLADLSAIAFGQGPGSLTGIRLASSVVKALAFAHQLPVIPVSSMAALAQSAYTEKKCERALIALDARMGQLYWGAYQVNANGIVEPLIKDVLCLPTEVHFSHPATQPWFGLGDGWTKYEKMLKEQLACEVALTEKDQLATAASVALLAKIKWQQGDWVKANDANPIYLK